MDWDTKFAQRTNFMKRSAIREILKLTQQPDVISFAGGLPAPELFPAERIREAVDAVLTTRSAQALQYSATEGLNELRESIAARMSRGGVEVTRENILIVSGAQQGIDLIGRVLLDEGDGLVVENPTYLGMLLAWKMYNLRCWTVDTDADGLLTDQLEFLLHYYPKLIYIVPNFQNPQGVTLSHQRRQQLARLLDRYDCIAVEDDPYGDLRYEGEPIPALYEVEARLHGSTKLEGRVIYCGSFSKILAPGLRIGWIAAPLPMIDKLVQAKQSADLHSSALAQWIAYEVSRDDFLKRHIERLRAVYHQRRDAMLEALARYFPDEVRWSTPTGGLFLMVTMPEYLDATDLLRDAIAQQVAFVPGIDFFVGDAGWNTFRLNFSNARPEMIEAGIRRLGELLKEEVILQPM